MPTMNNKPDLIRNMILIQQINNRTVNLFPISNNTNEGVISTTEINFTSTNWNSPQTVFVTGVDDVVQDGTISYAIDWDPTTGTENNYNFEPVSVNVDNFDND